MIHGDGTLGCPERAPFDAIAVAAGGPEIPQALLAQLAPGGRLVIPVGPDQSSQTLVRVTKRGSPATISMPACRTSSTSWSGSTRLPPLNPWQRGDNRLPISPRRTPSGSDVISSAQ